MSKILDWSDFFFSLDITQNASILDIHTVKLLWIIVRNWRINVKYKEVCFEGANMPLSMRSS